MLQVKLSDAEKATLDRVLAHHGKISASEMVRLLIQREAEWIDRIKPVSS